MAKSPKISVTVTEKDLGYLKIKKELNKLKKKPYVKIGIQGESASKKKRVKKLVGGRAMEIDAPKTSVVEIATAHEYGVPEKNIEERSFIRSTMNEKAELFFTQAKILKTKIISGEMTADAALNILGLSIQKEVKAKFYKNDWKKLDDPTRGGTNPEGDAKPLLDTTQLHQSITYKVEMDGKK